MHGRLTSGLLWVVVPLALLMPALVLAHGTGQPTERLAEMGPAPGFTLTAQDGMVFSSADLRGKVVAISFLFTRCSDVCPIATVKMVAIQNALGEQFGRDVFFLSVTLDPEHDTHEVLARYARALGVDPSGWAFLTGSSAAVREVARSYGVFHVRNSSDGVNHNLLTSLVDRQGMLRVQYMGERFDPDELLHDLRDLITEGAAP